MKKESNSTTNSTPSIDRTLSSIQSSSSHTTLQFTSNNDIGTPVEPINSTKSKNKKKKKKNKHKTQLPTMNSSQQMGADTVPISDNQRHRHGTETFESLQHADRGSIPLASTSHHNYQQRHPMSTTTKSLAPNNNAAKTVTTTQQSNTTTKSNDNDEFWSTSMTNAEERQKIREFWLQLGEEERRSLVKVEKEAVLRKMKEQQKHSCNCSVCGKKRSAIEDELEVLYDAYYEELEQYANHQQHYARRTLQGYPSMADLQNSRCASFLNGKNDQLDKGDDDADSHFDGDHDSEISDDDFSDSYADDLGNLATNKMARKSTTGNGDHFSFGNSLTVKGGILTVADDLLKNDGKKFLDMMERLAERRMQRDDEAHLDQDIDYYDDEEEDDDEIYEDAIDDDNGRTEEQRMEEGRRMFQIFAARMFEQRVLGAYREKVAKERQQRLIQELEEEDQKRQDRELKKQRDKERKKDKKRQLKMQQEQERLAKEAQRQAEEARKRAEHQQKLDAERQKRELERQKKVEERRIKEEERRLKEEEKRRRLKEEKERIAEKERRRKEEEDRDRREKEFLKEKERKEKELKDELARRDRELKEQILRHNLKLKERVPVPDLPTNTPSTPHFASISPSISLPQTEVSNSASITRQPKATKTYSETPQQQSSTNTILNPGTVPSDIRQPTLFSPPCKPFLDILQPSHPPFGIPPPLDNVLPSLAPLQYHQQPSSPSPIGVAPSVLNIGSSASGINTFPHPMEPSLSSHGISPLMAIGQLHISNSSPSSTATNSSPSTASPNTSISISPNHARRSSAVAGPIGSPVTHRFHGFGFGSGSDIGPQEMNDDFATGSHRTSANTDGGQDYSFFSNFLFGDSNKGNPSLPLIDTDLAGSYQSKLDKPLDRKRQFSMDSQAHEWKNGWSATSILAENIHGKLFGDALTERRLVLLDRAKAAYRKLDEITQTNSFVGGTTPYHTLIQLHRMMNDLFCDSHVDLPELSEVLIHSPQSGFRCIHHPQHGILISYYSPSMEVTSATQTSLSSTAAATTTPTADDPLLLRRSSLLSHNPLMPASSFPSYSLPNCRNSPFSYITSTNPPSPGSPHHFLNPLPPPPQDQYRSFLPTNPLSPPPLSTSPFEYSPTPFTQTSHIEKSDT